MEKVRKATILIMISITVLNSCKTYPEKKMESKEASIRPNIIYIMADDHAEKAISAYGGDLIQTPNLDRLAKEGMLFKNSFVANSICAPSRATMLTGKFSHMNGKRDNLDSFDGNQVTFPKLLQKAGYQTAMIGKWHLDSEPQGFDDWKILIDQGNYYCPDFVSKGDTTRVEGYVTDIITDYVLEYLDNRDKNKPFCMLYHHKAPHRSWMPNVKDLDPGLDAEIPLPQNFYDAYENRKAAKDAEMRIADMFLSTDMKLMPEYYEKENGLGGNDQFDAVSEWKARYGRMNEEQQQAWDAHYTPINEAFKNGKLKGKALAEWKYRRYMNDYLKCIKAVDDNIGRLLDYLDKNGLAENTIVVYTSDQGFYLGEHGWYDKRFMYEESMRTPLMIRFPNEIQKGSISKQLVQNIDYAPTFLDYAGVEIPEDVQGSSLRPILSNTENVVWRDALYYHYYEFPKGWHKVKRHYGVRTDRYKLIHFYNDIDTWELYDLENDPNEMNNLYDNLEYMEVRKNLHKKLDELQERYSDDSHAEIGSQNKR